MKSILCLMSLLFASLAAAQQTLSVRVCNVAHAPEKTVEQAEQQASFVMKSAGIEIQWLACGSETPRPKMNPREFVLTVADFHLNHVSARADEHIMAATWLESPTPQNYLVVYYSVARKFAESYREGDHVHVILAYAVAHEFGHQFMGQEHSAAGIMKADLSPRDLVLMKQSVLRFTRAERQSIQNALRTRDILAGTEIAAAGR